MATTTAPTRYTLNHDGTLEKWYLEHDSQINGKIAIYSRKSKFTGKGESIGNRIEECKKHIAYKYQRTDMSQIVVYEDEGFSCLLYTSRCV